MKSKLNLVNAWNCSVKIPFPPPVCCLKMQVLKYTELWFCLLFCMTMKLGLSHYGKNIC